MTTAVREIGPETLERPMLSTLIDVPPEKIWVGMPLEVVFHEMSDEITLPLFRPRV